jgi:hypothetical protein
MPAPDALLFDFSDSEWHFGLEGAARMANGYPKTPLLLHHWGCVDAPDFAPFNGDSASLPGLVEILSASSSSPQANPMNSAA